MIQTIFADSYWPLYLAIAVIVVCIGYALPKGTARIAYNCTAFAICGGIWYWAQTVPPNCADQSTIDLVNQILTEQRGYPKGIGISNIRTEQGGLFAHRFECNANIKEYPEATSLGADVHYTSEMTDDTHKQLVTVFAQPFAPTR